MAVGGTAAPRPACSSASLRHICYTHAVYGISDRWIRRESFGVCDPFALSRTNLIYVRDRQ